jgi:hypothetical protein
MNSSSKKEIHRHAVVIWLRQWVAVLMAITFSSSLGVYYVQNHFAKKQPPQKQLSKRSIVQLHTSDDKLLAQDDRPPTAMVNQSSSPGLKESFSQPHSLDILQVGQQDHPFPGMVTQSNPPSDPEVHPGSRKGKARFLQPTNANAREVESKAEKISGLLQPSKANTRNDKSVGKILQEQAKYIGPWKMTFASAEPELARDFCMKYLGAEHYYFTFPGMPSCAELQWVSFPDALLEGEVPKPWKKKPFKFFQFHFVKHHRRPTGPMTIEKLEQKLKTMHGNFTTYNEFMDTRVTMQVDDLDPIAARLVHDQQPFLARENVDGSFSLFMEVPHAILLEVVSPKLSVLEPQPWSRCDGPLPPAKVNWSLIDSQRVVAVQNVRPRGFVYASTKPQAAANLHASYFLGQHTENSSLLLEKGNGTCFEARAVQWSQPTGINKFEFQWIHWPSAQPASGALKLQEVESYQLQLRSNFSMAHANKWDHYMDFHAGLFIENCDPVIERLRADGVPHFLTPHFMKFMAVFIQDEGGLVYEVVCHKFSLVKLHSLPQWDFCKRLPPLTVDWSPLNTTS